eukprot:747595-Hanusia_phi.AAC.5
MPRLPIHTMTDVMIAKMVPRPRMINQPNPAPCSATTDTPKVSFILTFRQSRLATKERAAAVIGSAIVGHIPEGRAPGALAVDAGAIRRQANLALQRQKFQEMQNE